MIRGEFEAGVPRSGSEPDSHCGCKPGGHPYRFQAGVPGEPGRDGKAGFSPTVEVEQIRDAESGLTIEDENGEKWHMLPGAGNTGDTVVMDDQGGIWHIPSGEGGMRGHRVTITDAEGDHTFDVMNAANQDGLSPSVAVSAITGGHRVTITDAEGDHTFDVMDGTDGAKGDPGDPAPASAVTGAVEDWLEENISQETGYVIDASLSATGAAADAKAVGDEVREQREHFNRMIETVTGNKIDYVFEKDVFIRTENNTVDVEAREPHNNARCIVVPCEEGDQFTLTGRGYTTSHLLWVFVDENGTFRNNDAWRASSRAEGKNLLLTAPPGAEYLVVNANLDFPEYPPTLIGGKLLTEEEVHELPTYADLEAKMTDGVLPEGVYYLPVLSTRENTTPLEYCFEAMYTGSDAPTVTARAYGEDLIFTGQTASIGRSTQYIRQTFRFPNCEMIRRISIQITVPAGTELYVKNFSAAFNPYIRKGTGGITVHAHEGYDKLYPRSSYRAVAGAAELGFQSCIVIPKFTSNGVPVCFHNDGTSSSPLSAILKNPDGTEIEGLTATSKISDFTYAELMQWSIGYSNRRHGSYYAEQKILKVDDFLRICAKTGMRPVFSIHPNPTAAQWGVLKALLDKYRLTDQLSVVSGNPNVWSSVINAFGDGSIHSFLFLVGINTTYPDILATIQSARTSSGAANTRVDVEFFDEGLKSSTYGSAQTAMMQAVIAAGYTAAVVLDSTTTTAEMEQYMDMGVTEFTANDFCSIGLNW